MRNLLFVGIFAAASSFCLLSCGLHEDRFSSGARIAEALKEALFLGSKTAALNLGDSSCEEESIALRECAKGYLGNKLVEIALPDTVERVLNKINSFSNGLSESTKSAIKLGIGQEKYNSIFNLEQHAKKIKEALNRGAEQAALNSIGVFSDAIFGMSFSDANEILFGGNPIAATSYLEETTYGGLKSAFAPIIKVPLDEFKPNNFWEPIASNYNSFASAYSKLGSTFPKLPYTSLSEDLSGSLAEYATGEALKGLFTMVGKQEEKLRADPWGAIMEVGSLVSDAVGDLLGEVFSSAKK